jgi:hypothetical protein
MANITGVGSVLRARPLEEEQCETDINKVNSELAAEKMKRCVTKKSCVAGAKVAGMSPSICNDTVITYLYLFFGFVINSLAHYLFHRHCDGEKNMVRSSHCISIGFFVLGLCTIFMSIYITFLSFSDLLLSPTALTAIALGGVFLSAQGYLQYKAAESHNISLYGITVLLSIVFLVLQLVIAFYLATYLSSLGQVQAAAESGGRWGGAIAGDSQIRKIDHYVCESYRTCCMDPSLFSGVSYVNESTTFNLDNNETRSNQTSGMNEMRNTTGECRASHIGESLANQAVSDLTDPSRPKFCEYMSGTAFTKEFFGGTFNSGIPKAACPLLSNQVVGFNQTMCQNRFCQDGERGFVLFVELMLSAVRRNGVVLGLVFFVVIVIQGLQLAMLKKLHGRSYRLCGDGKDDGEQKSYTWHDKKNNEVHF